MALGFREFWYIGREQWPVQGRTFARLFVRLLGPLGMHARIRNGHVLRIIKGLDLFEGAHLLDAGCGHAYATFWLARRRYNYQITGIEIDAALVAANRRIAAALGLTTVAFRHESLEGLADAAAYDLIYSIDVLEHIVGDVATLGRLRRALKPGGRLLLHLPLRHQQQRRIFPSFRRHTIDDHVRDEYALDEIQAKLAAAGFELAWHGWGFGPAGELAFELNYLGWQRAWLRNLLALFTFPLALLLAYLDVRSEHQEGNSMLLLAVPVEETSHVPLG